jgi:hypothetical protein
MLSPDGSMYIYSVVLLVTLPSGDGIKVKLFSECLSRYLKAIIQQHRLGARATETCDHECRADKDRQQDDGGVV